MSGKLTYKLECTHGFLRILEEDPVAVGDAEVLLTLGTRAVDARRGLGRVAAHETNRYQLERNRTSK